MADDETYCNDQSLFAYPNLDGVGYIYAIGCHGGHYLLMIADLTAQKLKYVDSQNDTNERSYILRQFCQFLRKAWLFKHGLMSEFPWRLLFGEKGALFHKMWFQPTQMRSFLLKSCTRLKNKITTARVGGIYSLIALDYLMKDYCDESEMPPVDL
ncbi:MAG: hypothetical protein EZS28_032752, partial [Streblomastix strix]